MDHLREKFELWRDGDFNDDEAARITGLSVNALRDLQRAGALRASGGGGRGKTRTWKRDALCKGAMASAICTAGLSIPMGARLAFHYWNLPANHHYDPMLRFPTWDRYKSPHDFEVRTQGRHALQEWIQDHRGQALHDELFDGRLHIINASYVAANSAIVPSIIGLGKQGRAAYSDLFFTWLGRISQNGDSFISWIRPHRKRFFNERERRLWKKAEKEGMELSDFIKMLGPQSVEAFLRDNYADEVDLNFLKFELESDADIERAGTAYENFKVKTSINVTLAMRQAMRRAMGLYTED